MESKRLCILGTHGLQTTSLLHMSVLSPYHHVPPTAEKISVKYYTESYVFVTAEI